jgi:hypothetical protein
VERNEFTLVENNSDVEHTDTRDELLHQILVESNGYTAVQTSERVMSWPVDASQSCRRTCMNTHIERRANRRAPLFHVFLRKFKSCLLREMDATYLVGTRRLMTRHPEGFSSTNQAAYLVV